MSCLLNKRPLIKQAFVNNYTRVTATLVSRVTLLLFVIFAFFSLYFRFFWFYLYYIVNRREAAFHFFCIKLKIKTL